MTGFYEMPGISNKSSEQNKYLNTNICKCLISNLTNMSNFHSVEVVDRGSETQLQVSENLKLFNLGPKGLIHQITSSEIVDSG